MSLILILYFSYLLKDVEGTCEVTLLLSVLLDVDSAGAVDAAGVGFFLPFPAADPAFPLDFLPFFLPAYAFSRSSTHIVAS